MDLSCNSWKQVEATEFNKIKLSDLGAVVEIKTNAHVAIAYLSTVQLNRAENLRRVVDEEPEAQDVVQVLLEVLDLVTTNLATALESDHALLENTYFTYGFPTGFPVNSAEGIQWELIPARMMLKLETLPEQFRISVENAVQLLDSLDYTPYEAYGEEKAQSRPD